MDAAGPLLLLETCQNSCLKSLRGVHGAPGEIRTPDLTLRRRSLYPAELRARSLSIPHFGLPGRRRPAAGWDVGLPILAVILSIAKRSRRTCFLKLCRKGGDSTILNQLSFLSPVPDPCPYAAPPLPTGLAPWLRPCRPEPPADRAPVWTGCGSTRNTLRVALPESGSRSAGPAPPPSDLAPRPS